MAPDILSSGDEKSLDNMNQTSGTSTYSKSESETTQSFTFETQVFHVSKNNMHKALKLTYAQDIICLLIGPCFVLMLLMSY